jgi:hypothetical protein
VKCASLLRRRSITSPWCLAELGAFWGAGKRVLLFIAEPDLTDSVLPPQFKGDLKVRTAHELIKAIKAAIDGHDAENRKFMLRQIESSKDNCKDVFTAAVTKHYGARPDDDGHYINYLIENFLDVYLEENAAAQHGLRAEIIISSVPNDPDLLRWDETKTYTLRCPSASGEIPLMSGIAALQASKCNVNRILEDLDLTITIDGGRRFSFQDWLGKPGRNSFVPS